MAPHPMDTRFLETFLLVVDSGSIAAAARRLNITSAAVAQRIRALENEMGYPLIMRSGRTVSTTEAGASIISKAREFVSQVRDLKAMPGSKGIAGKLRLGAVSTAVTGFLPEVLSKLSEKYSAVDVMIEPGSSAILYQQVLTGELDAAIVTRPPFELPKTCDWHPLYREPLVFLKSAALDETDTEQLLKTQPFIRYDRRAWGGVLVDNYLRKIGAHPQERYELDALDAIAVLVDKGLGIALVPDWPEPWPAGLSVTKIPVRDGSFDRHIDLVWARATPRLRLVKALLDITPARRNREPGGKSRQKAPSRN
jgi:DNA-binding transcriptional LysR family regulator